MSNLSYIKNFFKKLIPKIPNSKEGEFSKISDMPRFTPATIKLFSKKIKIVDSASFLFQYGEIFKSEIYKFKTNNPKPYIVDCGANIGLSIIYFKLLYPNSEIVGFEPDKEVFDALTFNINSFKFKNVTLINKGLWNKETTLQFFSEGADGGRIVVRGDNKNIIPIQTVRLRNYLRRRVDFLKIDVEGAETKVLEDCQDLLHNVKNLFVEYHSFLHEPQTLDKVLKILNDSSFRYYISNIGVQSSQPFVEKKSWLGMDNQLNIYATKEK